MGLAVTLAGEDHLPDHILLAPQHHYWLPISQQPLVVDTGQGQVEVIPSHFPKHAVTPFPVSCTGTQGTAPGLFYCAGTSSQVVQASTFCPIRGGTKTYYDLVQDLRKGSQRPPTAGLSREMTGQTR